MMWVVAKERLTLIPVGGNSKLQPMATAATHGNGKLRIHDSSWPPPLLSVTVQQSVSQWSTSW